jgi:hypothetical protein
MMSRSEAKKVVPVVEAATDRPASIPVKLVPTKPGGWDPFDVWRERIQRPRELLDKTGRPQPGRRRQKS